MIRPIRIAKERMKIIKEDFTVVENFKQGFEYHTPNDIQETLELLAKYNENCKLIAGGTDLIPKFKAGVAKFDHLVSLKNVTELQHLHFGPQTGLRLGAMAQLMPVERNADVQKYYPALYQAIHCMANTQIRNRGTVVGNICNAVPSADTAPALLVYGATVKILSIRGERIVPIENFFTGVCRTALVPDEMVTEVFLPTPRIDAFSIYYKYTVRKALELAMIGVAVNVSADARKTVTDAKLALGSVAATPRRAYQTERLILGKELTYDRIHEAAKLAAQEDCAPISDIRATADYRREMVRIHMRDALRKAIESR
jgi:carbon-monoxide dehydrogenase medium subunit